jgi:hypothetical protein
VLDTMASAARYLLRQRFAGCEISFLSLILVLTRPVAVGAHASKLWARWISSFVHGLRDFLGVASDGRRTRAMFGPGRRDRGWREHQFGSVAPRSALGCVVLRSGCWKFSPERGRGRACLERLKMSDRGNASMLDSTKGDRRVLSRHRRFTRNTESDRKETLYIGDLPNPCGVEGGGADRRECVGRSLAEYEVFRPTASSQRVKFENLSWGHLE